MSMIPPNPAHLPQEAEERDERDTMPHGQGKPNGISNKSLGTDSYETLQAVKHSARFWAWAIPILVVVGLAALSGVGYMAKTALVGEIKGVINESIQREVKPLRDDIQKLYRSVDVVKIQGSYQAEQIREIKARLK